MGITTLQRKVEMAKVKLLDSAVGKTLKVAFWSSLSAGVAVLLAGIPNWNLPAKYAFLVPLVNTLGVLVQKLADKKVPNLPR